MPNFKTEVLYHILFENTYSFLRTLSLSGFFASLIMTLPANDGIITVNTAAVSVILRAQPEESYSCSKRIFRYPSANLAEAMS